MMWSASFVVGQGKSCLLRQHKRDALLNRFVILKTVSLATLKLQDQSQLLGALKFNALLTVKAVNFFVGG